ncbi:hypothetical protein NPIL_180901 [Nephila pilipes]|uniref:Uncharacterized protein n=1 Tax=Nephila pilipes TaxID=299642 RepID=A0A8X6N304_NEPPI|nr:hypothetical protein NPIL_180901 [Nephila pilipes]
MIRKLKSFYGKTKAKTKRSLPKCPSKRKIIVENLFQEYSPGIISQKQKKFASTSGISSQVITSIKEFYASDAFSYQAPGFKDFSIIRNPEGKCKTQERYLYFTLGEITTEGEIPRISIERSKFCDLRPEQDLSKT